MTREWPEQAAAPAGRSTLARRIRDRIGPVPRRDEWPPVSLIVLNRDGEHLLKRLLPRLATATDYPRLELILVDNASRDGSVELARSLDLPFPLTVVENVENLSFSDANDDGAEHARFDRLLFLNNDVEPFEPGWLKELVACLELSAAAAVGATLLFGEGYRGHSDGDYVIQHRGVEFGQEAARLVPLNAGAGGDLAQWTPDEISVPALTAACLLVRRDCFERVGGFTSGFQWGWEDVDLGLKLVEGGDALRCCGRSVLIHHESSTRFEQGQEWRRATKAGNQRLLLERWGPQVRREYMLDRLSCTGFWTDGRPPRVAIGYGDAESRADDATPQLADALEQLGWRVSPVAPGSGGRDAPPGDTDFFLIDDPSMAAAMLPPAAACIAWVRDDAEAWAEAPLLRRAELTLIDRLGLAPSLEAAGVAPVLFDGASDAVRLVALLRGRAERLRFCLQLSRDWELRPAALALRLSLERREHACRLQLADEWDSLGGLGDDVAVVIGEPGDHAPGPAQINVLYVRSAPGPTTCDEWDLVLLPDPERAAALAEETPTAVAALDLESTGDAAEPLLELIARVAARDGVASRVLAQA